MNGGVIRRDSPGARPFPVRGGVVRRYSVTDTPGIFTVPAKRLLVSGGGVIRKHAAPSPVRAPALPPGASSRTGTARQIEHRLDAQVADGGEVALGGQDGAKAEQLLAAAKRQGAAVLATITRQALRRLLSSGGGRVLAARQIYTMTERQQLADAIAATNATAQLLGRARIRLRLQRYEQHAEGVFKFSDPTPFEVFDDTPLEPFAPAKALEYFRRKISMPGVNASQFTQEANREAFTLAVNADEVVLDRIKGAIEDVLRTGKDVRATPRAILNLLQEAGITQTEGGKQVSGAYAENVFRTNMMESYRDGAQQELAEVADSFPVWRYVGISDGRQRPAHAAHFDKYYPSSVEFSRVRDSVAGHFDGFQCRCDFIPIFHTEWLALQHAGARVQPDWAA